MHPAGARALTHQRTMHVRREVKLTVEETWGTVAFLRKGE